MALSSETNNEMSRTTIMSTAEDQTFSPVQNVTLTNNISNGSIIPFSRISEQPCAWILYTDINNSGVRIWDVMILVPNTLFLAFLLLRLKNNVEKLRSSSSPIFTAFYGLVFVVSLISLLRCIVSMTVNASVAAGAIADKILWLVLRFFLLSTEASVIIFGIYFGHLDSRTSIRRVLISTSFFALVYSSIQGTLELNGGPHLTFTVNHSADNRTEDYDLFAHGGMIFLCSSSSFFCLVYCIFLILPLTPIKERISLPTKHSFYYYVATLALLNLTQAVGSLLLYEHIEHGLCVIDVTTYAYFTFFDPLVYGTFLWKFFRTTQTGILFSYKHQVDDIQDDDQLSLPYQTSFAKGDGDAASNDGFGFGSTHFDRHGNRSVPSSPSSLGTTPPHLSINTDYYQVST